MASSINTNISSLTAQRNLGMSQTSLATSMQRLSSGLRINSAKDDAAGLAISERFSTQIRGLNQASRNANDGISLAQTAEGSLGEITSNLQRIRELAVQSANSTNSASDRAALDLEVQQRLAEIDRVSSQSSFNGVKILDGSFGDASFQVGANVGETINVSLGTSMRQNAVGGVVSATSGDLASIFTAEVVGVTGVTGVTAKQTSGVIASFDFSVATGTPATFTVQGPGGAAMTVNLTSDVATLAGLVTAIQGSAGYAASGATVAAGAGADAGKLVFTATTANTAGAITIGGADAALITTGGVAVAGVTTVTAVTAAPAGELTVGASDFTIAVGTGAAVNVAAGTYSAQEMVSAVNTALGGKGYASLDDNGDLNISSGEAITIAGTVGLTTLGLDASTTVSSGSLSTVTVADTDGANETILRVDSALTSVSTLRSTFGAIQNRFESVIANLSTTAENLSAARSRIQDADFATETANLSRAQILQQAGTAMVAQANQLPQGVLALLR